MSALRQAKKLKASYCDIRINRYRDQSVSMRLSPERGTGKTLEVPGIRDTDSFGFGVRVIVDGAWGFASSPLVTPAEISRITARGRHRREGERDDQVAARSFWLPTKAYKRSLDLAVRAKSVRRSDSGETRATFRCRARGEERKESLLFQRLADLPL